MIALSKLLECIHHCEMKMSPAILVISNFWPSSVEESSPNYGPVVLPPPTVIAEELGERKKQAEQGNSVGPR